MTTNTTATGSDMPSALGLVHPLNLKCKIFIYQNQSAISMSATISTYKSTGVEPARYTCDILEYLWNQCRQLTALKKVKTEAIELSNILEDDMPRMQTMTRMFGLELELADCTTWWRWQGTLISSSLKTNYLKLSSKDEKREKISKKLCSSFWQSEAK